MKTNCSWGNNLAMQGGNCMVWDISFSLPSLLIFLLSRHPGWWVPRAALLPRQQGQRAAGTAGVMKLRETPSHSAVTKTHHSRSLANVTPGPQRLWSSQYSWLPLPPSHLNNLMLWIQESPGKLFYDPWILLLLEQSQSLASTCLCV